MFCWICRSQHSSVMKWETNYGSWLLMILQGMLNHGTKCCRYNTATPSPVMFVVHGINFVAFEQLWSIIVSTALKPFNLGRSMIKSIAIIWKGPEWGSGMIGCRGVFWCIMHGLFSWQVAHLQMYSSTNSFIPLPSYIWLRRWVVLEMLGCSMSGWSWYSFKILCCALSSLGN